MAGAVQHSANELEIAMSTLSKKCRNRPFGPDEACQATYAAYDVANAGSNNLTIISIIALFQTCINI